MSNSRITVSLVNNFGGGAETTHTVDVGAEAQSFVQQKIPGVTSSNSVIRVRRSGSMFPPQGQTLASNFLLADGDTVSVTPTKTAGACS